MATTVIQGIEKDFYLKESYDGRIPLSFLSAEEKPFLAGEV
jgi:hypothetical protein